MQRRQLLRLFAGTAAALAVTSCTPARVVLGLYNDKYKVGSANSRRMMQAFLATVLPVEGSDAPEIAMAFERKDIPFGEYMHVFLDRLDSESNSQFDRDWLSLDLARRTQVIAAIQNDGGIPGRLLDAAILLGQVAFYAGIHDDAAGCPAISFYGTKEMERERQLSYAWNATYLMGGKTRNGNFN